MNKSDKVDPIRRIKSGGGGGDDVRFFDRFRKPREGVGGLKLTKIKFSSCVGIKGKPLC